MKLLDIVFYICTNNHGVISAGAGAIIGAGISALASLGGGFFGSKSSREAQEEANKLTRELYYADREYNKPIYQVARLREAGLNPNLVYGGSGSVAGNTAKGAPKMESIGGYDVDFAGAVNAALTSMAISQKDKENKNLDQTNENLKATRAETEERTRGIKLDNDIKQHDYDVIKNSPVLSRDVFGGRAAGIFNAIERNPDTVASALKKGAKAAVVNSLNPFNQASKLIIPAAMKYFKGNNKNVDVKPKSSKPWFVRMQGKPWFVKSR